MGLNALERVKRNRPAILMTVPLGVSMVTRPMQKESWSLRILAILGKFEKSVHCCFSEILQNCSYLTRSCTIYLVINLSYGHIKYLVILSLETATPQEKGHNGIRKSHLSYSEN